MYTLIAAFVAALPAFVFAYVALRQRNDESYEERLERSADELRAENDELKRRLVECQEERFRYMQKLLRNGEK